MSLEPRHKSHAVTWTLLILALPLLYLLSIGPLVYLQEKGVIPDPRPAWIDVFYTPVDWLYEHKRIADVLGAYEIFWWNLAHRH